MSDDHQEERLTRHAEALEEEGEDIEKAVEPGEGDHAPIEDSRCGVVERQEPLRRSVRREQEARHQHGEPHLDDRHERAHDQRAARLVALVEGQEPREYRGDEDRQEQEVQHQADHEAAGIHAGAVARAAVEPATDAAEQAPHQALRDPAERQQDDEQGDDEQQVVRGASLGEPGHRRAHRGGHIGCGPEHRAQLAPGAVDVPREVGRRAAAA